MRAPSHGGPIGTKDPPSLRERKKSCATLVTCFVNKGSQEEEIKNGSNLHGESEIDRKRGCDKGTRGLCFP